MYAGLALAILMLCSGVWLFSVPFRSAEGLFILVFGAMTFTLVLATNVAVSRFQRWAIDYTRYLNNALTLRESDSAEASETRAAEDESSEEFEFFGKPAVEEKEEIIEEEIPA